MELCLCFLPSWQSLKWTSWCSCTTTISSQRTSPWSSAGCEPPQEQQGRISWEFLRGEVEFYPFLTLAGASSLPVGTSCVSTSLETWPRLCLSAFPNPAAFKNSVFPPIFPQVNPEGITLELSTPCRRMEQVPLLISFWNTCSKVPLKPKKSHLSHTGRVWELCWNGK